jgi:sec-independent protein translocase protein TatB
VFFDLNIEKMLVLGVIALVIFGPDQIPKLAAQAGRALRELRQMAEGARADLQEGLGTEFRDFDIADLNPRTFVRKHLWEAIEGANGDDPAAPPARAGARLEPGESPPYDSEAT